jgi:hypothetical protein
MRKSLLRRPSPGLILACVALFVALGGGAYAATSSDTKADKKIAKKAAKSYFNGHIGGASVSHANSASSATNATNATNASNATTASNANALGGAAPSAYASSAQQAFIHPTLNAGYSNYDATDDTTAGYMKDSLGFVHLEGVLNCPTTGGPTAFTLPVGFRPGKNVGMIGTGFDSKGLEVFITSAGDVTTDATGSGHCGFDGIVFPAAGTAGTSLVQSQQSAAANPHH